MRFFVGYEGKFATKVAIWGFGAKTAIIDIAKASAFMNYGIICRTLFRGRNDSQ
jgi:hypothetical protein